MSKGDKLKFTIQQQQKPTHIYNIINYSSTYNHDCIMALISRTHIQPYKRRFNNQAIKSPSLLLLLLLSTGR